MTSGQVTLLPADRCPNTVVTLPQANMSHLQMGAGQAHGMEQPTIDVNHPHMYSHAEQRYPVSRGA